MTSRFPLLLICLSTSVALYSHPQQAAIASGKAEVVHKSDLMEITATDRAILNWDSFSIGKSETLRFIQPSDQAAVLNRVIGVAASVLDGKLLANGQVYLINPNGMIIGKDAVINTASFIGTTLQFSDSDFLNNADLFFQGDSTASIIHLGTIESSQGPVALIAHKIDNEGKITANGSVSLIAGHEILLSASGDILRIRPDIKSDGIESSGMIQALQTSIEKDGAFSLGINKGDQLSASKIVTVGGKIFIRAEESPVVVSGELIATGDIGGSIQILGETVRIKDGASIDASGVFGGGEILVGGDYQGSNPDIPNALVTVVEEKALLKADAALNGDGGKIIVWSDEKTFAYNLISARGGDEGGDGGFVEVSGKYLDFRAIADRRAPRGSFGTLLLDPVDITIDNVADFNVVNPDLMTPSPGTFDYTFPAGCPFTTASLNISNVTPSGLEQNLSFGSITIDTSATNGAVCGGTGTIMINQAISWAAATTLTLTADSSITVGALSGIANSATSATPFTAIDISNRGTSGANYVGVTILEDVTSVDGDIVISGIGNGNAGTGFALGEARVTSSGNGNVTITGRGGTGTGTIHGIDLIGPVVAEVSTSNGNLKLTGTGGTGSGIDNGINLSSASGITQILSNAGGSITLVGQGGGGTGTVSGISSNGDLGISSLTGTIKITGTGGALGTGVGISITGTGINNFGITTAFPGSVNITGNGKGIHSAQGILLQNGGIVTSSGGDITVTGTGAASTGANTGIQMTTGDVAISSDTGTITLKGTGGGTGAGHGNGINTAADIEISGPGGAIDITGTGVSSVTASVTGLIIRGSLSSTGGSISLNGTGANAANGQASGIQLSSEQISLLSGATMTLTGIGNGASGVGGNAPGVTVSNALNVTLDVGSQWIFDKCTGGPANGCGGVLWNATLNSGNLTEPNVGARSFIFQNCTGGTFAGAVDSPGVVFQGGGASLECAQASIVFNNIAGGGTGSSNHGVWINSGVTVSAPTITATNISSGANANGSTNAGFFIQGILGSNASPQNISISANGNFAGGLGQDLGISIPGTIQTGSGGTIQLTGNGGTTPANMQGSNHGIDISGTVNLGTGATLTLTGVGGIGTTNAALSSHGVNIDGSVFSLGTGAAVTFFNCTGGINATGGNIGAAWAPATFTGNTNCSVVFNSISGGASSGGGGGNNYGVEIGSIGLLLPFSSTSISFNNIRGGGFSNGTSSNHGVFVNGVPITAQTITGTNIASGSGVNTNIGFYLTGAGAIMGSPGLTQSIAITATSLGTGSGEVGIQLDQGSQITVDGTATISLTGSSNVFGVNITDAFSEIIGANGDITITSPGSSIFLGNGVTVQSLLGNILAIADVSIVESGGATISTMGGSIRLVVDNAFPSPPGVGPGIFNIPTLVLNANGASLQLWGGLLDTGIFPSTLNGASYVAGSFQEDGIYFPFGTYPAGDPYFIYYKTLPSSVTTPAIHDFTIAIAEAFQRWSYQWYQDYLDEDRYPPAYTAKGLNIIIPSLITLEPTRQEGVELSLKKREKPSAKKRRSSFTQFPWFLNISSFQTSQESVDIKEKEEL